MRSIFSFLRRRVEGVEPQDPQAAFPTRTRASTWLRCVVSFTPWMVWLVPVTLLMGYLFWPGHLLPGNVDIDLHLQRFEYRQEPTESGVRRCLFAVVSATNRSGRTLRYRCLAPANPDRVSLQLIDDRWLPQSLFSRPGVEVAFSDGETLLFYEYVSDEATVIRVQMQFSSSWFGPIDQWVMSDEWQVPDDLATEGSQ